LNRIPNELSYKLNSVTQYDFNVWTTVTHCLVKNNIRVSASQSTLLLKIIDLNHKTCPKKIEMVSYGYLNNIL